MKQTLLIAERDAKLCDLYRRFFAPRGYEVEQALDGLDCLRKLRQVRPAALVLDLEMCLSEGDCIRAWLRDGVCSDVPVILTSASDRQHNLAELIVPPVVACLAKPFALPVLLDCIRSAVAQSGRREPLQRDRYPVYSELFIG